MKKILLLFITLQITTLHLLGQTYATDFNANDCDGNNHQLFSELDAGKVIVIAWVMPCATCITDPLSAFYDVQSYDSSHPGQVLFYMADDYANTSCSSLESWAANNGMSNCIKFSDAAVNMGDYGIPGMPKIVVLGSSSHKVYFNQNSGSLGISTAIDEALDDIANGLVENANFNLNINTFPNPANNQLTVSYELKQPSNIDLEIYNLLGARVISFKKNNSTGAGKYSEKIDVSNLSNGTYFLKINSNQKNHTIKFSVSH
jgi:hypothetical protein